MTETMLAVVDGGGLIVVGIAALVVGGVFSYLFLRANPDKKSKLDEEVEKISDEIKGK